MLPLQLAATEYESKTVTVFPASLFDATIARDNISFSDQGFDFIAAIGYEVGQPTISVVQNFLRLYDDNSLTIKSSEGLDITKVVFNISEYKWGYEEITGYAHGWEQDPDNLSEWTGQSPEFKLTVSYQKRTELNDDYELVTIDYVNIESITITYLDEVEDTPEPTPEYGAVKIAIREPQVKYTGTNGMVSFNLDITDDDGVERFTVSAKDASTGIEYGRADFAAEAPEIEDPQGAPIREVSGAQHYTVHGELPLSGITEGKKPLLRLSAFATYPDGTETHIDEADEPIVEEINDKPTGISESIAPATAQPTYYDLSGRRISKPAHGMVIEKDGNKAVKKHL